MTVHKTKEHKASMKKQMEAMAGGPMPMMDGPLPKMPKGKSAKKAPPKKAKGKTSPKY